MIPTSTTAPTAPGTPRPSDTSAELIDRTLNAVMGVLRHGPSAVANAGLDKLAALGASHPALLDARLRRLLSRIIRDAWKAGWLPVDVVEQTGRQLGTPSKPLVLEMIAAEHAGYSPATIDRRWQAQLDTLGIPIAGNSQEEPRRPLLHRWAPASGGTRQPRQALRAALLVANLLRSLPPLPRLVPLPGQGRAGASTASTDQKVLSRIRSLLAKAEATDYEGEADALSAKAQELMTKFAIDRAAVEAAADGTKPLDAPAGRRIWLHPPYISAKTHLVSAVARANGCRAVTTGDLGFVTVLGHETDLQLVELLTTSLLVQASREMLRAGRQISRSGQSRTRSYRHAFLVSYAVRIGERLQAAAAHAAQSTVDDAERLLPVLTAREERVDRLFAELFPATVTKRVAVANRAGWEHGRTAAELASLDARRPVERS